MSKKNEKPKRTSAGRPQQPKCQHCNKALYKRMDAGAVKTDDPYAYCRNPSCDHYNQDQTGGQSRFKPLESVKAGKAKAGAAAVDAALGVKPKSIAPAKPKTIIPPAASTKAKTIPPTAPAGEPVAPPVKLSKAEKPVKAATMPPPAAETASKDPASKARARIKKIIAKGGAEAKAAIGATLGILKHETGGHSAGNALIAELNLSAHGIEPVAESNGKKRKRERNGKKREATAEA